MHAVPGHRYEGVARRRAKDGLERSIRQARAENKAGHKAGHKAGLKAAENVKFRRVCRGSTPDFAPNGEWFEVRWRRLEDGRIGQDDATLHSSRWVQTWNKDGVQRCGQLAGLKW